MALDAATAQELIQKLNADREAFQQSINQTHKLLIQAIAAAGNTTRSDFSDFSSTTTSSFHPNPLTTEALLRRTAASSEVESLKRDFKGSIISADDLDSEFDDSESLFADRPLAEDDYTEEGFRKHLQTYDWTIEGKRIIQDLADPFQLKHYLDRKSIFPTDLGDVPDRSHLTHYSIFDVGSDGAPLPILDPHISGPQSRSQAIWNRIKSTNADPARQRKAVGRITIVREPSPLLFAALHYTHHKHFNVDELFAFLVDDDPGLSRPPDAFSNDHRMQRSFAFTMEYFTLIEEGCEPMQWQRADPAKGVARTHIPISRCSSVVALSLEGEPMGQVRNKQRRAKRRVGNVYDPFSPWRVLSITAFPDLRSSLDAHDTTKHYVNGPEAFLVTLRAEYRDASRRLTAVYKAISDMVDPPPDFIFSLDTRDKLLFEDEDFTYSRRYFWAYQTLGIMNEDINDMITAYKESFKDSVWNGTDKILWPGADDMASSKHNNWRKRMKGLRKDLEREVQRLKDIERMNLERMRIVKNLHNNLYNGTSVLESRRSVENAMITVQQGRNIKLLTLVTIFFLPLTFVTSVFGMTNMPQNGPMYHFAYATVAICIPTYILIGSLNTQSGMLWWTNATNGLFSTMGLVLAKFLALFHYRPKWTLDFHNRKQTRLEAEQLYYERRPELARRQSMEIVPRGTFSGMPMLSPKTTELANGHHLRGHRTKTQSYDDAPPPTAAGEKEKERTLRPHRSSNPAPTGAAPPHRPSIGVVVPPGQILPLAETSTAATSRAQSDVDPLEAVPVRTATATELGRLPSSTLQAQATLNAAQQAKIEPDGISEVSEKSRSSSFGSRRKPLFSRVFGGSAAKARLKKDEYP